MYSEFNIKSLLGYLLPKWLPYLRLPAERLGNLQGNDYPAAERDFSYSFSSDPFADGAMSAQFNDDTLYRKNVLGRPVFLPAQLLYYENGALQTYELPNPIVVISGSKRIVTTELSGRNAKGTVKEVISTQDYQIQILCTSISPDRTWPLAELQRLSAIWKKNSVLTLRCAVTDLFLDPKDNIVIKDISIPDMRGITNAQVVQLSAISDNYFELNIKS